MRFVTKPHSKSLTKLLGFALLGALLLGVQACLVPVGPPPHGPSPGYRYHYDRDDVDLTWDAGLGVYVVVGLPSVYFYDGHYYRHSGGWEYAGRPRGPWKPHGNKGIPPGLAKKYERRGHERHERRERHDR